LLDGLHERVAEQAKKDCRDGAFYSEDEPYEANVFRQENDLTRRAAQDREQKNR
jgi:hypothetical protein